MTEFGYFRKFYVGFTAIKEKRWWQVFTGGKRQHIYLITPCTNKSCVIIDFSEGGTAIYYSEHSAKYVAEDCISDGDEVLEYVATKENMKKANLKIIRSCVAVAKDFLGIDNPFILTPNQLYNHIKRSLYGESIQQ